MLDLHDFRRPKSANNVAWTEAVTYLEVAVVVAEIVSPSCMSPLVVNRCWRCIDGLLPSQLPLDPSFDLRVFDSPTMLLTKWYSCDLEGKDLNIPNKQTNSLKHSRPALMDLSSAESNSNVEASVVVASGRPFS